MKSDKWDKKLYALREKYPKITSIDWGEILRSEPEVFCGVVGKVTIPEGSKKSNIKMSDGNKKFAKISGTDYSELEFKDAFAIIYDRSYESLIEHTCFTELYLSQLADGSRFPSYEDMEDIAKACNRDPSFFMEYRIAKILSAIDNYLMQSPETASVWYNKVVKSQPL